jgi:hypothetical protein
MTPVSERPSVRNGAEYAGPSSRADPGIRTLDGVGRVDDLVQLDGERGVQCNPPAVLPDAGAIALVSVGDWVE